MDGSSAPCMPEAYSRRPCDDLLAEAPLADRCDRHEDGPVVQVGVVGVSAGWRRSRCGCRARRSRPGHCRDARRRPRRPRRHRSRARRGRRRHRRRPARSWTTLTTARSSSPPARPRRDGEGDGDRGRGRGEVGVRRDVAGRLRVADEDDAADARRQAGQERLRRRGSRSEADREARSRGVARRRSPMPVRRSRAARRSPRRGPAQRRDRDQDGGHDGRTADRSGAQSRCGALSATDRVGHPSSRRMTGNRGSSIDPDEPAALPEGRQRATRGVESRTDLRIRLDGGEPAGRKVRAHGLHQPEAEPECARPSARSRCR